MSSSLTKGTVRVQVRKDDASVWTSADPTLAVGEFGFESDTGKLKIGDGSTAWTSLDYLGGDTQYLYQIHQCYVSSGTDIYMPFGASTLESTSGDGTTFYDDTFWIAPFNGKLVEALIFTRTGSDATDIKLRINEGSIGSSCLSGGTVDVADNSTVYTLTCDQNNTFSKGDVINLIMDLGGSPNQMVMTTKWEID